MKVAIPVWNGRISPVLDVAKTIRVAEVERCEISEEKTLALGDERLLSVLSELGVDVLVCSAVSPPLEAALWMSGVEVIADVCGAPEGILDAMAKGDRELEGYRAPGSRRGPGSTMPRRQHVKTGPGPSG